MHSLPLPATTAPTPHQLWAYGQAVREIDLAIAALEDAAAALIPLAADTEWQSEGVRALHDKLLGFQQHTTAEIGRLLTRRAELRGVPAV